jgi:hypothetical protein
MRILQLPIMLFFLGGCAAPKHSDWQTIDAGPFIFSLPLEFQEIAVQGIDSYVLEYKSAELSVTFDYGLPIENLAPLAEHRGVSLIVERIGGHEVDFVCFKVNPFDDLPRHYQVAAGFKNSLLGMSATSETLDGCETAKEIFRTVRFK